MKKTSPSKSPPHISKVSSNTKVVAFIHAKGSSERIKNKNQQLLGKSPLFVHGITNALGASRVNEVIIDSDDDFILSVGEKCGATPLKRPNNLANNQTEGNALARWAASQRPQDDIYVQVMCTSPFLKPETIDKAIQIIEEENVSSVVSTYRQVLYIWEHGKPIHLLPDGSVPNSRLVEPYEYETQGLYVTTMESIKRTGARMDPDSHKSLPVSLIESIDIDTEEELAFARALFNGLYGL